MPRPKRTTALAEKTAEKGATRRAVHPLFPAIDADKISSLWLYRLARPRQGARLVPELLAGPIDPAQVTSDAHLIPHGPGVLRLMPRRADGTTLGDPYDVRLRDERGRVPELVTDFDEGTSELAAPNTVDAARAYRELLVEQREEFKRLRAEDKALNEANFQMFGALVDKTISAMQAMNGAAQAPASSEPPKWLRDELRELRKGIEDARKTAHDREVELIKLRGKKPEGEATDMGKALEFFKMLPAAIDGIKALAPASNTPAAPPPAPTGDPSRDVVQDATVTTIDGVMVPSRDYLMQVLAQNKRPLEELLTDEALNTYRALHKRGVLPFDFVTLLGDALK